MKILVLGKRGQLTQAFQAVGVARGHEIIATSSAEINILDAAAIKAGVERIRPDVIINTAAYNLVPKAEEEVNECRALNTTAPIHIAAIANEYQIRFVNYSTDYVFDGTADKPYTETDTPHPLQVYGQSKLDGEIGVLAAAPNSLVIRTCGVYGGIVGSPVKGNFVLSLLKAARDGQVEMEVAKNQIATPTYAVDLAIGTLALLEKSADPGIYHLINEGQCSWAEFAAEIVRLNNLALRIIPVYRDPIEGLLHRPEHSVLANTKAKALGVILPTWQDALQSYIQFLNNSH